MIDLELRVKARERTQVIQELREIERSIEVNLDSMETVEGSKQAIDGYLRHIRDLQLHELSAYAVKDVDDFVRPMGVA